MRQLGPGAGAAFVFLGRNMLGCPPIRAELLRCKPAGEELKERDQLLRVKAHCHSRCSIVGAKLRPDTITSVNLYLRHIARELRWVRQRLSSFAYSHVQRILLLSVETTSGYGAHGFIERPLRGIHPPAPLLARNTLMTDDMNGIEHIRWKDRPPIAYA